MKTKKFLFISLISLLGLGTLFTINTDVPISLNAQTEDTISYSFADVGFINEENISTINIGEFVVNFEKGSGTSIPSYFDVGTALRLYNGNIMTFDHSTSYDITSISFTTQGGYPFNNNYTLNNGTLSINGTTTTISDISNANNIIFTKTSTGVIRIQSITINYQFKEPILNDDDVYVLNQPLQYNELNSNGYYWYSKHYSGSSTSTLIGSNIEIKLDFPSEFNGLNVSTTALVMYSDTNNTFGNSYGFYVSSINNYFNAFKIQLGLSSLGTYRVYLCNVNDTSRPDITTNDLLIATRENDLLTYNYNTIYCTNSNTLTTSFNGVNSMSTFAPLWSNCLTTFDNTYDFNFATYSPNYNWVCGAVYDLQPYLTYFNITDDFSSSYAGYTINFNYDDLSLNIGGSYIYSNNILTQGTNAVMSLMQGNLPLNQLEFLYNVLSFNNYPQNNNYDIILNDYFSINTNALNDISRTIYFDSTNQVYTYDNLRIYAITYNKESSYGNDFILKYNGYYDNAPTTSVGVAVYNGTDGVFLNGFDKPYLTLHRKGNKYMSISQFGLNFLDTFDIEYGFAQTINGWYTFDFEPFNDTIEYNNINLNISFTSNNESFNNLIILYDNVMNTKVATIYYRLLDNNNNVVKEYVVYEYSNIPYSSKWVNINYRQIYFDKKYVANSDYLFLDSIGTFTFISNNTNNDYTFNDLFWGIADIPFITLSNFLGFELFGVELFTAFCSILSVAVILWVVRKIL